MHCNCCGAPRPKNPWITGIWYEKDDITPKMIAYRCVPPCTNNRDIPWSEATDAQRNQAILAQQSADAACEMAVENQFK